MNKQTILDFVKGARKQKLLALVLVLLFVAVSTFALPGARAYVESIFTGSGNFILGTAKVTKSDEAKAQVKQNDIPEYIIYGMLFRRLVQVKKSQSLEQFKKDMQLNPEDFTKFDQIAEECEKEVAVLDTRAREIINEVQKKFPNGKLPPGQAPPPPPQELSVLQQNRNNTILRYRDRLRSELPQAALAQVDLFIQNKIKPNTKPL